MGKDPSRRDFLKTSLLAGLGVSLDFDTYTPLLSFSTLGCPDWTFDTILRYADENGYDGIELRGIRRELDLTLCPEFSSKENISASLRRVKEKKLKIIDLGASAVMHHREGSERKKNLDEAKRFIRLAQQLSCPYIRVFPNVFPADQGKDETIALIVSGLRELGYYAKDAGVKVLMITHGDVIHTADLENIMESVGHPNVGLGWDIANMWAETNEPPKQVYERLKKYIHLTFIKDLKKVNGRNQNALPGQGYTPIWETIDMLAENNYRGYYSFEWEKYWDPGLEEPEVVIPVYAKSMRQHFKM